MPVVDRAHTASGNHALRAHLRHRPRSNDNLYTSGVIEDVAADQSKGYDNALLRKYDASGKLLWAQYVAFIRKYDAQGGAQWTEECSLAGGCRLGAIAIAASGNVYAGGAVSHPIDDNDDETGLVAKYAVK